MSYFEAVNNQNLRNAWARFEDEGIILIANSRNAKILPRAKLAPDWTPRRDPTTGAIVPEGRLWDFIERIAQSRREGKNRRDGATVASRVLRHTENIARNLFAVQETNMSEEDKILLKKKQKRRQALQARAHL